MQKLMLLFFLGITSIDAMQEMNQIQAETFLGFHATLKKRKRSIDANYYDCPFEHDEHCDEPVYYKSYYIHMLAHIHPFLLICPYCVGFNKSYNDDQSLRRHVKQKHLQNYQEYCDESNKEKKWAHSILIQKYADIVSKTMSITKKIKINNQDTLPYYNIDALIKMPSVFTTENKVPHSIEPFSSKQKMMALLKSLLS